jgi:hypothetical protein
MSCASGVFQKCNDSIGLEYACHGTPVIAVRLSVAAGMTAGDWLSWVGYSAPPLWYLAHSLAKVKVLHHRSKAQMSRCDRSGQVHGK